MGEREREGDSGGERESGGEGVGDSGGECVRMCGEY